MIKLLSLIIACLILASSWNDAMGRTYLYDEFYLGMTKNEVEKILPLNLPPFKNQYTASKTLTISEYEGIQCFSFNKKDQLEEFVIIFDLTKFPDEQRPRYLNRRHDAYFEVSKFLNDFSQKIFFITHTHCSFMGIDKKIHKKAIRDNFMQYYALGKSLFLNIEERNKTVEKFFKAIPKDSRIIEVMYFGSFIQVKFTTFGKVYKKDSQLKKDVERLSRALQ